jgi:predicted ester cyclase
MSFTNASGGSRSEEGVGRRVGTLGMAVAALIAAGTTTPWRASAADPPTTNGNSITAAQGEHSMIHGPIDREDIRHWEDAWNSHDIQRVLGLFDPGVVIHQPSNPKPLDLEGARSFFSMIFRAYPDFHVTVKDSVIEGLTAVSVEQVTGTWLGALTDPATGKTTAGNGRRFDHPGAMLIKYGPDHRILSVDIFWDRLMVNQQLGI